MCGLKSQFSRIFTSQLPLSLCNKLWIPNRLTNSLNAQGIRQELPSHTHDTRGTLQARTLQASKNMANSDVKKTDSSDVKQHNVFGLSGKYIFTSLRIFGSEPNLTIGERGFISQGGGYAHLSISMPGLWQRVLADLLFQGTGCRSDRMPRPQE
jgi:hypothetical protein